VYRRLCSGIFLDGLSGVISGSGFDFVFFLFFSRFLLSLALSAAIVFLVSAFRQYCTLFR